MKFSKVKTKANLGRFQLPRWRACVTSKFEREKKYRN